MNQMDHTVTLRRERTPIVIKLSMILGFLIVVAGIGCAVAYIASTAEVMQLTEDEQAGCIAGAIFFICGGLLWVFGTRVVHWLLRG